jgi:protein-serine/threonine kinase
LRSIQTDGTTIGPVLGKLVVVISEGRALRPSIDPYVVCDFQQSQYISEGPIGGEKREAVKKAPHNGNAQLQAAGERRRPMAIPMRSRQSSSSGRDGRTEAREVTNPRWDHKAVL